MASILLDPVSTDAAIQIEVDVQTFRISAIRRAGGDSWASGGWMTPPDSGPGRSGVLRIDDIKRAASIAERVLVDRDLASLLIRHAQADAQSGFRRENTAAFLFAWTVVERWVYRQVDGLALTQERLKKIRNWNSVDAVLEVLEVGHQIGQTDYARLMHWKALRNRVVHSGATVATNETRDILSFLKQVLQKQIGVGSGDAIALEPLRI